ncbi:MULTISPECIES: hypothetical protein [Rheinheimera]|uniref:hypothetical protein n=1 Tax=Rheinheimera TaxID=67575 RepID=UPI00141FDF5E|nr:hypothetical protein [Rheinheimera pleomorphica]
MKYCSLDKHDKLSLNLDSSKFIGIYCCFFISLAFTIDTPSAERWIFTVVFAVSSLLMFSWANEVKLMVKRLVGYRFYTLTTFALVPMVAVPWFFEIPSGITMTLTLLVSLNCLVWPFVTVSEYEKNYTAIFGLMDA